jgi:hypothetical protein
MTMPRGDVLPDGAEVLTFAESPSSVTVRFALLSQERVAQSSHLSIAALTTRHMVAPLYANLREGNHW